MAVVMGFGRRMSEGGFRVVLSCQGENESGEDGYGIVLYAERPHAAKKGWWGYGGVKPAQLSA